MEKVEIRLVTMPFLTPDERSSAVEGNEKALQKRLDFERQYLAGFDFASKEPRPIPPWDYRMLVDDEKQQASLRQYIFLWLRTEPTLLPSHYYRSLSFRMETTPWGTIRDEEKMKQYREILAELQRIVFPYDKPSSGEFVGE